MRTLKRAGILFLFLAALASILFVSCGRDDGVTRILVSHTNSAETPWQDGAVAFANLINQSADGRLQVDVFPHGALSQGNSAILMEQVQSGAINVGIEALTVLAGFNDRPGIMQVPFAFSDEDHVLRFLELNDPTWAGWMMDFENSNFVILGASPRPFRQLNNNQRMIRNVEDMDGLVFRVPVNPMFVEIFEALGARPVPAPSSEIYTGIQLGTFHGEDNSIPLQYDFRTFEVAQYFTIINYMADLSFIFMNRDFYHNSSAEDRMLFHEAAAQFVMADMAGNRAFYERALAAGSAMGVEFYVMPEAARQGFRDRLVGFNANFQARYTPEEWYGFFSAVNSVAP